MAVSFKLPLFTFSKVKKTADLPKFEWERFKKEKKLESGGFGTVHRIGKHEGGNENVVVKKMKGESLMKKKRFI